jgi:parallel beta-helix repeat protein
MLWMLLVGCGTPSEGTDKGDDTAIVGETGDSADSSDSADSGDTDSGDSADSSDSGETADTGDCGDPRTWYLDADGDGHGSPDTTVSSCAPVDGYVLEADDCDDADTAAWTGAPELCDGQANDCSATGWVEADEAGTVSWFPDVGAPESRTEEWAAGRDGAPARVVLEAGDWSVCAGTFYVSAVSSGAVTLTGRGSDLTVLSGGGRMRTFEATDDLEMRGVTLADGTVEGEGGDLLVGGALDASDLVLRGGSASNGGGLAARDAGDLVIEGCSVLDNTATGDGGGIYVATGSALTLTTCTVQGNEAYQGGGVRGADSGGVSLTDVEISENRATSGAGLYWDVADVTDNTLERVTLQANEATASCGGACVYAWSGTRGTITLVDVALLGNLAGTGYGGGLFSADTLDATSLTIAENVTTTGSAGGAWLSATELTVTGATVTDNRASTEGGGLSINYDRTFSMSDATFTGNAGGTGGGLYVFGYGATSFTLDGLELSGNLATYGGGMALDASNGTVSDTLVSSNDATYYGGGVYANSCDGVTMSGGVRIEDNVSAQYGGGIYLNYCTVRLQGDSRTTHGLRRNSARYGGGAFANLYRGDTLTVTSYDFGEGADDNVAEVGTDVYMDGGFDGFGDPSTFTCTYGETCE